MALPKIHKITYPFTASVAEDIDQNFDQLFRQVAIVETGRLPVTRGGTGLGSYQVGDILYAETAITIAGLHDVVVGNVLVSGGVNNAPEYGKVALSGSVTHITGILPVPNGGTGHGVYAVGDIVTADTTTTLARVADVATGNALISGGVGVIPAWGKIGLTTHVAGVLPEANGGTNQSTYAQGDLIYASAANTLAKLAKDTSATRYLSNTGASNNPAWAQVDLTNGVTGILPTADGGTGLDASGVTDGQLLIGRTSDNSLQLATLTPGTNITITNGGGTIEIAASGAGSHELLDGDTHTDTDAYTVVRGSLIVGNSTPLWDGLPIGAANRVLRSDGTDPNWGQVSDAFISDVTEAKITDGSILARVADLETITGNWIISGDWTFSGDPVFDNATFLSASALIRFVDIGGSANEQRWRFIATGETFALEALSDDELTANNVFTVQRSGAAIAAVVCSSAWTFGNGTSNATNGFNCGVSGIAGVGFAEAGTPTGAVFHFGGDSYWDATGSLFIRTNGGGTTRAALTAAGSLTIPGALNLSGSQNITLSTGNNNNVALNATTVMVRLTSTTGSTNFLTGLTGGASGRIVALFRVSGTQGIEITSEDANSTAANRFVITGGFSLGSDLGLWIMYDGTSSRWRILG